MTDAETYGYKPYPSYKISGASWLGEIPEHWEARQIRTVARVMNGATPSTSVPEYWDGDVVWITPDDLVNHGEIHHRQRTSYHSGRIRGMRNESRTPWQYRPLHESPHWTYRGIRVPSLHEPRVPTTVREGKFPIYLRVLPTYSRTT